MDFDFWNFLAGLLTGGGGVLLAIRITKNIRADHHGNVVDQSRSRATGDIVGRDKK